MGIASRRMTRIAQSSTPPGVFPMPKIGWVEDGAYASANNNNGTLRMPDNWAITSAGMRHCVLNIGLNKLVNVTGILPGQTTYIANSIEDLIAPAQSWNDAHPTQKLTVHVRLHVGIRAPDYWSTRCNTVKVYDPGFVPYGGDVPRWWEADYLTLYDNAMKALAPAINNNPIIGSVNAPGAALFYPEPMLFFPGGTNPNKDKDGNPLPGPYITNQTRYENAGWNALKHKNFMMAYPIKHTVFTKVIELDINPPATGGVDYRDFAQVLIDTMPTGYACISNYSMSDKRSTTEAAYVNMYNWMKTITHDAWVGVQLARSHKVSEPNYTVQMWDDMADRAEAWGFHFVETTGGVMGEPLGDGTKQGTANAWPTTYQDEPATMLNDTALFAANPGPVALS